MTPLSRERIRAFMRAFPDAQSDLPLRTKTYLKIGGPARLFFETDDGDRLVHAIRVARAADIPVAILGGGSNLLVADAGYEGVVVQNTDRDIRIKEDRITAAAGAITALIARKSVDSGLAGFEWGVGIPGTIGGAVYGNAGCFGGEMRDVVESVEAYFFDQDMTMTCTENVRTVRRGPAGSDKGRSGKKRAGMGCRFGYRDSRFKHETGLILRVTVQLKAGDLAASKKKMDAIIAARKTTQPQGAFSAGCLFKNYEIHADQPSAITNIPSEFRRTGTIPAGWLIDTCGLKGTRIGDAEVSRVHANFIVNRGHATAEDIHALYLLIQKRVQEKTGIVLENEVQFLGF